MRRKAFRLAALAVSGGLLVGCGGQTAEDPEPPTDNDTAATAAPVMPEVDLEQYSAALVTDAALVGEPADPPVEGFVDDPVTMYLTLNEFEPSGSCAELLDELNSFTTPAVGGISAKFQRPDDQNPSDTGTGATDDETGDDASAAVETMIFETVELTEPMAIYREIPNACETLSSTSVEGAEATFTKVPGLDAVHLEISDGDEVESLAVGGSSVNARFHMYMTAEQVSLEEAEDLFGAQAEKLRDTFRDRVDSAASPQPSPEPTDE